MEHFIEIQIIEYAVSISFSFSVEDRAMIRQGAWGVGRQGRKVLTPHSALLLARPLIPLAPVPLQRKCEGRNLGDREMKEPGNEVARAGV